MRDVLFSSIYFDTNHQMQNTLHVENQKKHLKDQAYDKEHPVCLGINLCAPDLPQRAHEWPDLQLKLVLLRLFVLLSYVV